MTFRDVMNLWPRTGDFAAEIGVKYVTAAAWRRRNSIPAWAWRRVAEQAQQRGHNVSIEMLADAAQTRAEAS